MAQTSRVSSKAHSQARENSRVLFPWKFASLCSGTGKLSAIAHFPDLVVEHNSSCIKSTGIATKETPTSTLETHVPSLLVLFDQVHLTKGTSLDFRRNRSTSGYQWFPETFDLKKQQRTLATSWRLWFIMPPNELDFSCVLNVELLVLNIKLHPSLSL